MGSEAATRVRAASVARNGTRTASIPIEGIRHAGGLLFGFADEIEILDPPELRDELRQRADRVRALYG